jgi:hypothetical protein
MEEKVLESIEQKVKPPVDKLAELFSKFELSEEVKGAFKMGIPLIGSLKFTKMMMFANEVQLTNSDIDWYMDRPAYTMEDETKEEMKIRNKFANTLYKFRSHLYDYSVFNKNYN